MMEPVAWVRESDLKEMSGSDGIEMDVLPRRADGADVALVRLSDAEARIAELEATISGHMYIYSEWAGACAEERARTEAAEALLKEALPLLNHLSRETTTDHIGDEWLTPTAIAARAIRDKIGGGE